MGRYILDIVASHDDFLKSSHMWEKLFCWIFKFELIKKKNVMIYINTCCGAKKKINKKLKLSKVCSSFSLAFSRSRGFVWILKARSSSLWYFSLTLSQLSKKNSLTSSNDINLKTCDSIDEPHFQFSLAMCFMQKNFY